MPAQVIDLESRRKVWRASAGHCRACHAEATRMLLATDPFVGIECHECGAYAFDVTPRPLTVKPS